MAKNEAASREINDQVEEAHQLDPPGRRFQIACECALKTCGRGNPRSVWTSTGTSGWILGSSLSCPEHFIGNIEWIVYENDRFAVTGNSSVRKSALNTPRQGLTNIETWASTQFPSW